MKRYPGLVPFETEQKDIFFGRKKDIEKLSNLIFVERKVLLYSKSGYGKTSLLNAGIIPKLKETENFEFIKIRFQAYTKQGNTPNDTFLQTIKQNKDFKTDNENKSLIDIYANEYLNEYWSVFKKNQLLGRNDKTYILIFDQFEELFSYPPEQISVFKNSLADLLQNTLPLFIKNFEKQLFKNKKNIKKEDLSLFYQAVNIKALFSIRSDRMSELNKLADRIPDIQKVFYELKPLDKQQIEKAIIEPAKKQGDFESPKFDFEPQAIDKIINELSDHNKQNIETTQLQIVCQRIESNIIKKQKDLKKREVSAKPLNILSVLETEIPDFKDIFLSFYNEAIAKVKTDPQATVSKFIGDNLIAEGRRISLDELVCTKHIKKETLATLVDAFLLRAEPNSFGGYSYELAHDTLVEPIQGEAEKRYERERIQREKEKAETERVEREKEKKRQRKIIIIVSIAAVISIAFGIFGFWQMRKAKNALIVADEQRIIAEQKEGEIKKSTTNYYLRDANAYIQQKKYRVAMSKYLYLRDTLMNGETTPAIEKRIAECKNLIDKNHVYDSLMKQAKVSADKEKYSEAVDFYSAALDTEMDDDKVISELKDLLIITNNLAKEYLSKAEAVKNINPKLAAQNNRKAASLRAVSSRIQKMIQ